MWHFSPPCIDHFPVSLSEEFALGIISCFNWEGAQFPPILFLIAPAVFKLSFRENKCKAHFQTLRSDFFFSRRSTKCQRRTLPGFTASQSKSAPCVRQAKFPLAPEVQPAIQLVFPFLSFFFELIHHLFQPCTLGQPKDCVQRKAVTSELVPRGMA